ncbi:LysR family transcriptional regulator [Pandoraea anapnoica]|uniref:LysR family transcriptional regulator n=1 Tax=Pandoraea anapnoica TaxID=2508301 RepID=A0A5E5A124_9BURK|nr:LysR substrate-binding domain-containing protein [Pandoraea anapnoica]VVE66757.1 LysR family transcriptional regulator [Pandoraea anapnoica]
MWRLTSVTGSFFVLLGTMMYWRESTGPMSRKIVRCKAILDTVLAGQGIALLSDWLVAEHLTADQLEQVLPDVRTHGFPIHAVWQKNQLLSAKVRHVVDLLAARFSPDAPWEAVSCKSSQR